MRTLSKDISKNEGREIELFGWVDNRRDHGKIIFVDLRDRSGIAQLVFAPGNDEPYSEAEKLRPEWVIKVKGEVKKRPSGMENSKVENGQYEIPVSQLEILSQAETPPIPLDGDGYDVGEETRMKYRYLDIRRKRLKDNLRKRYSVFKLIRDILGEEDFVEIETPILGKSTPEGARDYLVPSRLHAGKFYALPQSPQQYKQLLMVGGIENYFQIAKVFRDEDTRGDRQPEFTQLDIEKSFTNEEEILNLTEKIFLRAVKEIYPEKELLLEEGKIPRISYKEAMEKYGNDRPDLRTDKQNSSQVAPLFVVDFPAFEWKEQENRWDAVHHPFTMPKIKSEKGYKEPSLEELKQAFRDDPSSILAFQYDLVINGYEAAGGSIRIHNPDLLKEIFVSMGNKPEDIDEKFGHMLDAFKYGVPPHGGIAWGLDRVIMVLQNEPSIRETVAFPKTGDGRDVMMNAPSEVSDGQLKELHIKVEKDSD